MSQPTMFGQIPEHILRALKYYDDLNGTNYLKGYAVKNDPAPLTFSEAVETVYAIQKRYASGVDKKWVEVQLKSFVAMGLIKFKEETEQDNVIIEAKKFAAEYVEYDFKNPANTISQMSRIIGKLLHIIKGDNK